MFDGQGINPLVGDIAGKMMKGDDMRSKNRNVYDNDTRAIDSTPLGTAIILLASGGVLLALKASGFRFSIGVGK